MSVLAAMVPVYVMRMFTPAVGLPVGDPSIRLDTLPIKGNDKAPLLANAL